MPPGPPRPTGALAALGELIARARVEAELSQRDLARLLGLANHGDISQWETGRRPVPQHHLAALGRELSLDIDRLTRAHAAAVAEIRRRRVAREVGLTAGADTHAANVDARDRTPLFVGREGDVDAIRRGFENHRVQILWGAPGIGKTQLALAYAAASADTYDLVWLIRCTEPTATPHQVAELAPWIGVDVGDDAQHDAEAAIRALRERSRWLLILDDVADLPAVRRFAATDGGGHVLGTSRHSRWRAIGLPLEVGPIASHAATEFLRRRTGTRGNASRVASLLGGIPLALEQAGALIESGVALDAYAALLEQAPAKLLGRGRADLHDGTLTATINTAILEAAASDPRAADVIAAASLLADAPFPIALILDEDADEALARLRAFALITGEEDASRTHGLVQAIVRDQLSSDVRDRIGARLAARLDELTPANGQNPATWATFTILLPHILAVRRHVATPTAALGVALLDAAAYLAVRGQYTDAVPIADDAVSILRGFADHARLADALHNAGSLRVEIGDAAGAEALIAESLTVRRRLASGGDIKVAGTLAALADVKDELGRPAEAIELLEQALKAAVEVDPDHHHAIVIQGNLGLALAAVEPDRAVELHRDALARAIRTLGERHPTTAHALANLALSEHPSLARTEAHDLAARATEAFDALALRDAAILGRLQGLLEQDCT